MLKDQIIGVMGIDDVLKGLSETVRKFVHDTPELNLAERNKMIVVIDQAINRIAQQKIILDAAAEMTKIIMPFIPNIKDK
jgi:hypothetical protein